MAAEVLEDIREQALALLGGGSRFRTEKIVIIVVYMAVSLATLVWSFSGDNKENELGARYGFETLAPLDTKLFFLENTSGEDWTRVRVVLNRNYLFKADTVASDARLMLRAEDFDYFFYVPRPWGREAWELLGEAKKPGPKASPALAPKLVEVRARQGRLDIDASKLQ